jgi:hypothetical protein
VLRNAERVGSGTSMAACLREITRSLMRLEIYSLKDIEAQLILFLTEILSSY